MPVRLAAELHCAKGDALLTTMIAGELTSWLPKRFACATGRLKDRDGNQRSSIPRSNRQEPRINILAIRGSLTTVWATPPSVSLPPPPFSS